MWSLKNIEIALRSRLISRASLLAVVPAENIRPEGTGDEAYPAVNYLLDDLPLDDAGSHEVTVHIFIDTQSQNQAREIAAEIEAELWRKPQAASPVPFLDLSAHGYRVVDQRKTYESGPIYTGGMPATFRNTQRYTLRVIDQST